MKHIVAAVAVLAAVASASAWATPCDQVIASIDAKIKAKGVKSYTLEAVPVADVKDRKVVGVCEVGAKKIVYSRTQAMTTPTTDTAVAQTTTTTGTTPVGDTTK